jgi:uncharacterized membrane protein
LEIDILEHNYEKIKMKKTIFATYLLVLLSFLISIYYYPQMPNLVASHWNANGDVNGYMSKLWGLFLLPLITLGLVLLLSFVPRLDPLKENIKQFQSYYEGFILSFTFFMLLIHCQIILWNLGIKFSMNLVIPLAMGFLFFYLGILLKHVKRNWFIGIRTPWTLSSDVVWDKTHKLGGDLFKLVGILCLIGLFFQKYVFLFVLLLILIVVIFLLIYSYYVYKVDLNSKPRKKK